MTAYAGMFQGSARTGAASSMVVATIQQPAALARGKP